MPSGVTPATMRTRFAARFDQPDYTDEVLQAAIDVAERQNDVCVWGANHAEAVLLYASHYAFASMEVASSEHALLQAASSGGESVTFRENLPKTYFLDLLKQLVPLGDQGGPAGLGEIEEVGLRKVLSKGDRLPPGGGSLQERMLGAR
ncbi:MAG: DUF4054 domain-containing protein, partial [Myxococcota bacterium]